MANFKISLTELLTYGDEALALPLDHMLSFFDTPAGDWIHDVPRLLIILDGAEEFTAYGDHGEYPLTAPCGSVIYCSRRGYLHSITNRLSTPHRTVAFSYYPEYIRAMHIDYDGINPPPSRRDTFYHNAQPLEEGGLKIIETLDILHRKGFDAAMPALIRPLLTLTLDNLRHSEAHPVTGVRTVWEEINNYLRTHCEEPQSRTQLAKLFRLSPGYISRLSKQYAGMALSEVILHYKMERAALYLRQSRLSVDEIAFRCGFQHSSYFIRRFKRHYHCTPHVYRNVQRASSCSKSVTAVS